MHEEIRKEYENWIGRSLGGDMDEENAFESGYIRGRIRLKRILVKTCYSATLDETQGDIWETVLYALSIIGIPESTFQLCDTLDDVGKKIANIYGLKGGDLYDHKPMSEALL